MAWLGSTLKTLDTRKEIVNYIGGQTIPSRVAVTNNGGDIDSSVVTLAELALLSGVSSSVQTQLTGLSSDKEDAITGAATTVTSSNLANNRVLLSDASGKIAVSDMTATTFGYLDQTSSLQTMRPAVDHNVDNNGILYGLANRAANERPPAFANPNFPR